MPTDITPFLRPAIPKTDSDLEKDLEISKDVADKMVPSYLKDLYRDPFNQSLTLSDEELDDIREACLSDSTRIINYLDSVLKEKQDLMDRQVKSLEHIAEQAYVQASSSRELSENAKKCSDALDRQVLILKGRLETQKEQLEFAKSEAASAKKDALFAKITSIITLIISVLMPLISG